MNRAATARPAAVPLVQRAARGPGVTAVRVQAAMRVSSPADPAEREAESTAKRIMRMARREGTLAPITAGAVTRALDEKERKRPEEKKEVRRGVLARLVAPLVHRKAEGLPDVGSNVAAEIQASDAAGQPLPPSVRQFMEPRFRADFGGVRIHTSDRAATLNRHLAARAFTVGSRIFFGRDQFRPESEEGKELIAHELTHTIQQGSVAQRSEDTTVSQRAPVQVQRLGISDALDYFADKANNIPGFRMFTILLGVNPINMSRVERSAANILRAIVEFIPGGHLIVQALDNHGIFDKIGRWVDDQLKSLGITGGMIRKAIDKFLDSLSWKDIFHLGRVWDRAKAIFTDPISRIIAFAKSLAGVILNFIKDAILRPLAALAAKTRGYDLLKAVLGRDPITGDAMPQTAETLIAGFMKLIGQEDVWQRMQQSKAVPRAWAWFKGALAGLLGFVREIPGLFIAALKSLTIGDVVLVAGAFAKVARVFGDFILRFISWAGATVWTLLEIIFDVVSPGALRYIKRTGAALKAILKNPLPFVGNLVKAAKGGFLAFAGNFLTHLKEGLLDWLTGSLSGIYIPKAFTLQEIVKFVLSVLGLTWDNIRQKLVKVIGEPAVVVLEKTFDIVVTLVREGPAAAWDKIKEQLANLQDMVIGGITDMVVDTIKVKAIPKLVAMFIPGAGFISAILSIYDMIMVFVQKIAKIVQVVTGFIDSLVAIAAGQIGAAVKRVEGILAGLLTLAINFLAGFAGLGKVADKVMGVIQKIRAPIDKALDWLVNFIVTGAKNLGRLALQAGVPQDPAERLRLGTEAAVAAVNALRGNSISAAVIDPVLGVLKARYGLKTLMPVEVGGDWWVEAEINPKSRKKTNKRKGADAVTPAAPAVGDQIQIRSPAGGWSTYRYRVTQVAATTFQYEFAESGSPPGALRRGQSSVSGRGTSWRPLVEAAVPLADEEILRENGGPTGGTRRWSDLSIAKKVLNFRHHIHQQNPPNRDWEHIVEQAGRGEHSDTNLALADRRLNQVDLNQWFGSRQPSSSDFPSTGPLTVREYLDSIRATAAERQRWKERAYRIFRVSVRPKNNGRGPYQTLD